MSDLVGTVRTQEHDDGSSVWVKVARTVIVGYGDNAEPMSEPYWLCIYSSAYDSNNGRRCSTEAIEHDRMRVVAAVPGTPAADPEACPYTHAHTRHWCGCPTCRES